MRQRSLVEPQSSTPLHPALQAVLENLDVRLEEELSRYRRLRARKPVASGRRRARIARSPEAVVTPTLPSPSPHAAVAPLPLADPMTPNPWESELPPTESTPISALAVPAAAPLTSPADDLAVGAIASRLLEEPDDHRESSEQLLRSLAEEESALRRDPDPGMLSSLLTPLGIGSMLLLLLSSVTFGYLLMNPDSLGLIGLGDDTEQSNPSSGSVQASPPTPNGGASPESAVVPSGPNLADQEFVDLNLDTLSRVPATGTAPTTTAPVVPAAPLSASPVPSTAAIRTPVAVPSPDQSSVTIPLNPPPTNRPATRAAAPAPVRSPSRNQPPPNWTSTPNRPPQSANPRPTPPSAARSESAHRSQNPPTASAPSRSPSSTDRPEPIPSPARPNPPASEPVTSRPAAPAGYYYVGVPYTGDQSLEQVRQVVPDAYVRNTSEGAINQVGAYTSAERAAERQRELQQQGIPAQVYRP